MIFKLYTQGKGIQTICNVLTSNNVVPPISNTWRKSTVRAILKRVLYIGKMQYTDKRTMKKNMNGKIVRVKNPNPEIIIADGLHKPIIDIDTWNKAQIISNSHLQSPTVHVDKTLKNPFATLLKCKKCGMAIKRITDPRRIINNKKDVRLVCKNCDNISSNFDIVEDKLMEALNNLLNSYKLQITDNDDSIDMNIKVIDNSISQNYKELELAEKQKSRIFDLLEQGIYDKETFLERNKMNATKIVELNENIKKLNYEKQELLRLIDSKQTIIPRIENVIQTYYQTNSAEEKNTLLKTAIAKIEYLKENPKSSDDFELTIYPLF